MEKSARKPYQQKQELTSSRPGLLLAITVFIASKISCLFNKPENPPMQVERKKNQNQAGRPPTHLAQSPPDPVSDWLNSAKGAFSHNTKRALRSDLGIYLAWCCQEQLIPWPSRAGTLVRFINSMSQHKAPATVRRYVSSIVALHKATGWKNPLGNMTVRMALQRMYRRNGRRQTQACGLNWCLRQKLLEASGNRLIDARNRALLAVAYDAMLRRSELVSLQVPDLLSEEIDGSATLLVRRSKTDSQGEGAILFLAPDSAAIVREWLQRSGVTDGCLFRSIHKSGALGGKLDASQIPRIYKSMATCAGLSGDIVAGLAGHSARVGATQDMIASGIELPAILQAGRWKSTSMVNRYGEHLLARRGGIAQLAQLQERNHRPSQLP